MSVISRRLVALPALVAVAALLALPGEASAAPPVADSGPDVTVVAGTDAQLQGSATDPDGGPLEMHWMATVVDQGDESSCTFSGPWGWEPVTPAGLAPTLTCTEPGKYLLQLVVGDFTSSDDDTGALITFTDPDTTPATCSLQPQIKGPARIWITDPESDIESFTMLDTFNIKLGKNAGSWFPPTDVAVVTWTRPSRGAGMALISHQNGAGLGGECVLFVRRNGTAVVMN